MEIKSEDFLKNVQRKQETEELEKRLSQLKEEASSEDSSSSYENVSKMSNKVNEDDAVKVDITEQELSDIMIGENTLKNSEENEVNKKKYLILGLILIILFLLTIVIIRLLNSPSEDDSFEKDSNNSETSLENDNIEEQYQKIIDEKLKNIKEQNSTTEVVKEQDDTLNIEKIEEKEKKTEEIVEKKPDVFGIKEEVKKEKKETSWPVKKEVLKEPKVKKEVVKEVKKVIASKPNGTYIQVGAFSRQPAKKYLSKIEKNGLNYTIYKVTVNGKVYNKVLIGPYKNRNEAQKNMDSIKRKLNISSAFILRF